jgi:hypothetical protein
MHSSVAAQFLPFYQPEIILLDNDTSRATPLAPFQTSFLQEQQTRLPVAIQYSISPYRNGTRGVFQRYFDSKSSYVLMNIAAGSLRLQALLISAVIRWYGRITFRGKHGMCFLTTQLSHAKYEEEDIFRSVLHDTVKWLEVKR